MKSTLFLALLNLLFLGFHLTSSTTPRPDALKKYDEDRLDSEHRSSNGDISIADQDSASSSHNSRHTRDEKSRNDGPRFELLVGNPSQYSTSEEAYRREYGLPAYNGPDSTLQNRDSLSDFNSAGFLLSSSDLQSEASNSAKLLDLALSASDLRNVLADDIINKLIAGRSRSDFESLTSSNDRLRQSSENELASYLKAAASEASRSEISPSSSGDNRADHRDHRDHRDNRDNSNNGFVPSSRQQPSSRNVRKPMYTERVVEEQHIFDPAVAKHFLKQRDSDFSANSLLSSTVTESTSNLSDNDFAQLAAQMSEFSSSSPSDLQLSQLSQFSSSDLAALSSPSIQSQLSALSHLSSLASSSGLSGSPVASASSLPSISTNYPGPSSPSYGSSSSYPGTSSPYGPGPAYPTSSSYSSSSYPSASTLTGTSIPPGAMVGSPGSAPPPGMKLAGYVSVAPNAPAPPPPPMGNPMMGPPMGNPMAASMMSGHMMNPMMNPMAALMNPALRASPQAQMMAQAMAQSMAQGMRVPFPGMPGAPTAGAASNNQNPNQAIQSLLNQVTGQDNGQTGSTSGSSSGSSSSSSQSSRQRFLSRLNPMNLFKRLRNRNGPKNGPVKGELDVFDDRNSPYQQMAFSESQFYPRVYFMKRMGDAGEDASSDSAETNDTAVAENGFFPFASPFQIRSGSPYSRFGRSARIRFPGSRRIRRYQTGRTYYGSDSRMMGLMGSGNFEVIKGGTFPTPTGQTKNNDQSASNSNTNSNGEESYDEDDDENIFSPIDDNFFNSGNSGLLGFQGFNHFNSGSLYNSLAATNQKSSVMPEIKAIEKVLEPTSTPQEEKVTISSLASTLKSSDLEAVP